MEHNKATSTCAVFLLNRGSHTKSDRIKRGWTKNWYEEKKVFHFSKKELVLRLSCHHKDVKKANIESITIEVLQF